MTSVTACSALMVVPPEVVSAQRAAGTAATTPATGHLHVQVSGPPTALDARGHHRPPREAGMKVLGACPHDCPDTCSMVIDVVDGTVTGVRGNPDHPYTRGALCTKVNDYEKHAYHPGRLLYPMRRSGPKGSGEFTRISWNE